MSKMLPIALETHALIPCTRGGLQLKQNCIHPPPPDFPFICAEGSIEKHMRSLPLHQESSLTDICQRSHTVQQLHRFCTHALL